MMMISGIKTAIIYVLRLEQIKFYVGKTLRPVEERFLEHKSGLGAEWTKKFPPIAIEEEKPEMTPFCEDNMVKSYMEKFGIENVRGGSYCKVVLNVGQIETLRLELLHANDRCLGCGQLGHFMTNCPLNQMNVGSKSLSQQKKTSFGHVLKEPIGSCNRCGRIGHLTKDCFAHTKLDGRPLNKLQKATGYVKSPRSSLLRRSSAKKKCKRCGHEGHSATQCFAKTHVNGSSLPDRKGGRLISSKVNAKPLSKLQKATRPMKYSRTSLLQRSSFKKKCRRCGYEGHSATQCFAKTHINGSLLVNKLQKSNVYACLRCGREGHWAKTCVAAFHKDGGRVPPKRKTQ